MRISSIIVALLLVPLAAPASAQQSTRQDFKDWCQIIEGRWVGDVTWVADWAGFGKKGEKVTAYLEAKVVEDGNAVHVRHFGGNGSGSCLTYFDSGEKQIKALWVQSSGAVSRSIAYRKDGQWIEKGSGSLADGTKTEFTSTMTLTDSNTLTCTGSGTVGGKKTDDQHDVWRRVSK